MWYNIKRFVYTIRPLLWIPGLSVSVVYGIIPIAHKIHFHFSEEACFALLASGIAITIPLFMFWEEIYDRWNYYRD